MNVQEIIANEFWLPGSPLRDSLAGLIGNQPILNHSEQYQAMMNKLWDEDVYIKDMNQTQEIVDFLKLLHDKG